MLEREKETTILTLTQTLHIRDRNNPEKIEFERNKMLERRRFYICKTFNSQCPHIRCGANMEQRKKT